MMVAYSTHRLRGELLFDEPMASHTSWRVGGNAARYYRPADEEDLGAFLASLPPGEPIFWLGLGSNILVRDGGLNATVISTFGVFDALEGLGSGRIRSGAGVACAKLARFSARQGCAGGEFLAGIPGTVGGALAMNAGAFGGETWDRVALVETIARGGQLHTRSPGEYRVGYRSVSGPEDEWFLAATFQLEYGEPDTVLARIKTLLDRRNQSQPTRSASCGSVFRNPEGDFAARLIEAAGLKGARAGGALVSSKHANFIVNGGEATAADIEELITRVRDTVQQVHGIKLETEVRIVGIPAAGRNGGKSGA